MANKYTVKEVDRNIANAFIVKYHYSGKYQRNSNLHLGLYNSENILCGVLQFGCPINPKATPLKIYDDKDAKMKELSRMAMLDSEPRNSESQAIGACIKWLKKNTDLDYLLSFSDGKEGNVGYIYQATNWLYIGYKVTGSFYDLDGIMTHSVAIWKKFKKTHTDRDTKTTNQILCDTFNNVKKMTAKQHVYLFPLHKKIKFRFELKPYPKKDTEVAILKEVIYKDSEGVYLPKGKTIIYSNEVLTQCYT